MARTLSGNYCQLNSKTTEPKSSGSQAERIFLKLGTFQYNEKADCPKGNNEETKNRLFIEKIHAKVKS